MKLATIALCLALFACSASGQPYNYQTSGYKLLTDLSQATTCTMNTLTGSKPALCPVSAGVPLTPYSPTSPQTEGSTTCITAVDGKSYEAVFSLTYPATGAVPGCTSNAQCSPTGTALPGLVCGTNGPSGVPNTCWPLAPSGCPFTGDTVVRPANSPPVASAGRKLAF